MIRIFGFVIIKEKIYDSMCEIIDRIARDGTWLTDRENYYKKTIKNLQEKLEYAKIKHPDLKEI